MLPVTICKKRMSRFYILDISQSRFCHQLHITNLSIFQVAKESDRNIKARDHHHAGVQHSIPTLMQRDQMKQELLFFNLPSCQLGSSFDSRVATPPQFPQRRRWLCQSRAAAGPKWQRAFSPRWMEGLAEGSRRWCQDPQTVTGLPTCWQERGTCVLHVIIWYFAWWYRW